MQCLQEITLNIKEEKDIIKKSFAFEAEVGHALLDDAGFIYRFAF